MLRILGNSKRLCRGMTRRDWLRVGGVGSLGLTLADLLSDNQAQAITTDPTNTFRKAKSCIVLFLYGGWSQLDTFDTKPEAPAEVRGDFKTISSSTPGLRVCEHLPRMAQLMDRVTLVRSLTHKYPTHCVAYALSGIPENPLRNPRDYWPFYSSTMDYLWNQESGDNDHLGIPRQMCLPFPLNSRSRNKSHRGLTPAWLGKEWEPVFAQFAGEANREQGFPSADGSQAVKSHFDPFDGITRDSTFRFVAPTMVRMAPKVGLAHEVANIGLDLPSGVTANRFQSRRGLLEQFNNVRRRLDRSQETRSLSRYQQMALDMITSPRCATAMDVRREPASIREKYGFTLFGQSALAARRLVESGVRVVTVYWDEYGPQNTAWDTHVNNFPRLREGLCPTLDQVYSTLMEDLEQRGMLDETVVLLLSEHGRTPQVGDSPGGGREHWAGAYCGILAGAGVQKGQVIGTTDAQARFPVDRPLNPKDILATLYHLMGFDPDSARTYDQLGRPHFLLPYGGVVNEILA